MATTIGAPAAAMNSAIRKAMTKEWQDHAWAKNLRRLVAWWNRMKWRSSSSRKSFMIDRGVFLQVNCEYKHALPTPARRPQLIIDRDKA